MRCLRKTRKTTVDSARLARSAQLGKRSPAGFVGRSDGVRAAATTKPARESALLPSWFAQTRPASSEPGCVRLRERDTRELPASAGVGYTPVRLPPLGLRPVDVCRSEPFPRWARHPTRPLSYAKRLVDDKRDGNSRLHPGTGDSRASFTPRLRTVVERSATEGFVNAPSISAGVLCDFYFRKRERNEDHATFVE